VSRAAPVPAHVIARRRRVGARLRGLRLERNLTQETVALRAGMDRASYVRIEQGQSSPLLDTLILIADAIGVPLAELVREG